jgi:hypothetical protein
MRYIHVRSQRSMMILVAVVVHLFRLRLVLIRFAFIVSCTSLLFSTGCQLRGTHAQVAFALAQKLCRQRCNGYWARVIMRNT